ncbi:hypothetical protein WK93_22860 [Burkholderia ubonensis]|nr:hypothetical protein WK93_22860 [Burkholderia ubonensis]
MSGEGGMGLLAVKHLDPVVGVDVHSVLVAPSPTPVFLPHPHVGFMLDLREYVEAAKGVVGSIAMTIVEEKVTEYIEDHPDEVKKFEHMADATMQQFGDIANAMGGNLPDIKDNSVVEEGVRLAKEGKKLENRISDDLGANVGAGGSSGRPILVNGLLRATAGTHAYHVPGLHFPLGESFVPPPAENPEPSNDGESFMGSKTVLANNDPMSYMALQALSCWSIGMEPPPHNGAHTERTYPSMPSSVMLPIPVGRPVMVGGPPVVNMVAAAKGLFKAFRGSGWAKALADKLHLKSGFLRCKVLRAEPVDAVTGEVVIQQRDFTVAGRLPLVWGRYYASGDAHRGAVGMGWQTPADIRVELLRYDDGMAAVARFPDHSTAFDVMPVDDGWHARVYDWQRGHALYLRGRVLALRTRTGIEYEYALPPRWQHMIGAHPATDALVARLGRMADLNGNAWVFERDRDGRLVRIVEWTVDAATGRRIEIDPAAYAETMCARPSDLPGAITLIDADDRPHPLVRYEYDQDWNLSAAVDAMGQPHRFIYSEKHLMVRHISARGVSFHYSHQRDPDGKWRVGHAWGDNGVMDYRFDYDLVRRETKIFDSLGYMSILQANDRGLPVASIDPHGAVSTYLYDARGRTCAQTDPCGRTTRWEYDDYGNLLSERQPDGSVAYAEYDSCHRPINLIDYDGCRLSYIWDDRGNLLEGRVADQIRSRYRYDRYGQLSTYSGADGGTVDFRYDRNGFTGIAYDATGSRAQYKYDAMGNVVEMEDEFSRKIRYEYDGSGNLVRVISPGSTETYNDYDADGNLIARRHSGGEVVRLAYSSMGKLEKKISTKNQSIEYFYDTEARLIGIINENRELYRIERDASGRIVSETDYWGQTRNYAYDAAGRVREMIDPLGRTIRFEFDEANRAIHRSAIDPHSGREVAVTTYSFDGNGNMVVAENPDTWVELEYGSEGRVVVERQGERLSIANVYDSSGRRTERILTIRIGQRIATRTVRYAYDERGALITVQAADGAMLKLRRDAQGKINIEHLGENLSRQFFYDMNGLMARQILWSSDNSVFECDYTYSPRGDLLSKMDSENGADRYQYDESGKPVCHLDPTGQTMYFEYDPAGNLLKTKVIRRDAWERVVDGKRGFRIGEHNGIRYTFDRGGNLVSRVSDRQRDTFHWSDEGLLTKTVTLKSFCVAGKFFRLNIETINLYDSFRRRVKKSVLVSLEPCLEGDVTFEPRILSYSSHFLWDGDVLALELIGGNLKIKNWLAEAGQRASLLETDSLDSIFSESEGEKKADDPILAYEWINYPGTFRPMTGIRSNVDASGEDIFQNSSSYVYHCDQNDAPNRVTDFSGGVIWECRYTAWGHALTLKGSADFEQSIRLQGQYCDAETGLHYNRHRYYDPWIGQYISQDPVRLLGGGNLYTYGPNVNAWSDPLGLTGGLNLHGGVPLYGPGSTELSRASVWAYMRRYSAHLPSNIEVLQYSSGLGRNAGAMQVGDKILVVSSMGSAKNKAHAERVMMNYAKENGISPSEVKKMFSILSPCAAATPDEPDEKIPNCYKQLKDWVGTTELDFSYTKIFENTGVPKALILNAIEHHAKHHTHGKHCASCDE